MTGSPSSGPDELTGSEAVAVALRLAVRLIDGAPPGRIRDLLVTDLLDAHGADGVLDVATAALVTLAQLVTGMTGDDAHAALLAGIVRCESGSSEEPTA